MDSWVRREQNWKCRRIYQSKRLSITIKMRSVVGIFYCNINVSTCKFLRNMRVFICLVCVCVCVCVWVCVCVCVGVCVCLYININNASHCTNEENCSLWDIYKDGVDPESGRMASVIISPTAIFRRNQYYSDDHIGRLIDYHQ